MEVKGSVLITVALPIVIALIMFGLGLTQTRADFARVLRMPKATLIGLGIKLLILPSLAFALCLLFGLSDKFAIGLMMLAAAPSSAVANIFSRLAKADVAFSLCLTAVDNVIASATLPLFVGLAFHHFAGEAQSIGLQWQESVKIFLLIIVPVLSGMMFKSKWPAASVKLDKVLRAISVVVLGILIIGVFTANKHLLAAYFAQLTGVVATFNVICYGGGYFLARLTGLNHAQSLSIMFAMGIQGTALVATIGLSFLGDVEYSMPAAFFSLTMYLIGFALLAVLKKYDGGLTKS